MYDNPSGIFLRCGVCGFDVKLAVADVRYLDVRDSLVVPRCTHTAIQETTTHLRIVMIVLKH
jgi:hypothetical protein